MGVISIVGDAVSVAALAVGVSVAAATAVCVGVVVTAGADEAGAFDPHAASMRAVAASRARNFDFRGRPVESPRGPMRGIGRFGAARIEVAIALNIWRSVAGHEPLPDRRSMGRVSTDWGACLSWSRIVGAPCSCLASVTTSSGSETAREAGVDRVADLGGLEIAAQGVMPFGFIPDLGGMDPERRRTGRSGSSPRGRPVRARSGRRRR